MESALPPPNVIRERFDAIRQIRNIRIGVPFNNVVDAIRMSYGNELTSQQKLTQVLSGSPPWRSPA